MTAVVRARALGKRFGDVDALVDFTLDVEQGEVLGLLGPNGAGKTTFIRLLLGMLRPTSGSLRLFGSDASRRATQLHRRVAYVPGDVALWPKLTGGQTLDLLGRLHGGVDAGYRGELVGRFALDPNRRVRAYSKGNRQKVALIAALATRADLLVLDEPTGGLDPLMEREFRRCVRDAVQRGQTVLLSSHVLSEVQELCDRVALVRGGRVAETGTLQQLRGLSTAQVEITTAGPVPDLRDVPGVHDLACHGHRVSCRVTGSLTPLLAAAARSDVIEMVCREPSLEELFLLRYSDVR